MEHNESESDQAPTGLLQAENKWQDFVTKVRAFFNEFTQRVYTPISECVPEFDFVIQKKDIDQNLNIEHFYVVLFGEVKAGKTMLLKALIGDDLPLPSSAVPCTSVLCTIRYGPSRVALIQHRSDPTKDVTIDLSILEPTEESSIREIMEEKLLPYIAQPTEQREDEFEWKSVDILWPSPLLKSGLTFIDAPGFGENDLNNALLMEAVGKAHLLLIVLNANSAFKKEMQVSIRRFSENMPKEMFFVATKFDQIEAEDNSKRSLERAQQKQISYIKNGIASLLPEFKDKLNDRFHAVAAKEIVVHSNRPLQYKDRFNLLEQSINEQIASSVKSNAAELVLRNLDVLLRQTKASVTLLKMKKAMAKQLHEQDQQQWSNRLVEIEKEKIIVDKKFVELVAATETQIGSYIAFLFQSNPTLVSRAEALVDEFHESWKKSNTWDNSKDQKKHYSEDMKRFATQKLCDVVTDYWTEKEKEIHDIILGKSKEADNITAELRRMIEQINQDINDHVKKSTEVNPEIDNVSKATLSTDSTTFVEAITLLPIASGTIGGVAGGVIGALVGGALIGALVAGIPLAVLGLIVGLVDWRSEYNVEDATLTVRTQMKSKLKEVVMAMQEPCTRHYCEVGKNAVKELSMKISAHISLEITKIKSEIKNLEIALPALNKLTDSFYNVLNEINELEHDFQNLYRSNPFNPKNVQ